MSNDIDYHSKYLKYKKKYLDLKINQDSAGLFTKTIKLADAEKSTGHLTNWIQKNRVDLYNIKKRTSLLLEFLVQNEYIISKEKPSLATVRNLPKRTYPIMKLFKNFVDIADRGLEKSKDKKDNKQKEEIYSSFGLLWNLLEDYYESLNKKSSMAIGKEAKIRKEAYDDWIQLRKSVGYPKVATDSGYKVGIKLGYAADKLKKKANEKR